MPRALNDREIAQQLEDKEEEAIDSASENEQDHEVIISDHYSASEQSENESDNQWNSEDEFPLMNLARPSQSRERRHGSFYLGRDGQTKWYKQSPYSRVRTHSANILTAAAGPRGPARNVTTMSEAFLSVFSREAIELVLNYTNEYILSIQTNFQRERDCKILSYEEFLAFFGLLYMSGVLRSSHLNYQDLWATDGTGIEFFPNTMTCKRFLFILRCLRFDSRTTREARQSLDKLAAIRDFCSLINENFQKCYSLSENVTIDEQLPGFRGKFSGVVYMPSKPTKYGIKHFALVDSATYYLQKFEVYVGRQPDGPFKLPSDTASLVKRMIEPISGTGRNVTMDNWFTSVPLAKSLLEEHKLTVVGTLRKNKPEIPRSFQPEKNREATSSLFGFQKDLTLCSYVPKPKKAVLLLSTMHHNSNVEGDRKPEIIHFYNKTKGGVDTNDQMCANYNVGRRTKRWPMVIFFHIVNVSGINSCIIYKSKIDSSLSRRIFLKRLAVDLVKPHQLSRAGIRTLPRPLQNRLKRHLENEDPASASRADRSPSYKRCHICPRIKDRKTKTECCKCLRHVCNDHVILICQNCNEDK